LVRIQNKQKQTKVSLLLTKQNKRNKSFTQKSTWKHELPLKKYHAEMKIESETTTYSK
jgi:hypothetical protein